MARTFAWAGSSRSSTKRQRRRPASPGPSRLSAVLPALALYLVSFALVLGTVLIVVLAGVGALVWIVLVVVVVVAVMGYAYLAGSLWWAAGAGAPMLAVRDGVVRGRIRPVAKRAAPDPKAPGWWDFEVPLEQLAGAKLVKGPASSGSASLLLGLPAAVSSRLLDDETTAHYASQWLRYGGSAAGWPVGRMLRRPGRAARVDQLIDALGTPESAPR